MINIRNAQEWTWPELDKSKWGDGPWVGEPDKMQWIDGSTGLDCLLLRNPRFGNLCGYVGVPQGHPLYGKHYDDAQVDVSVHGGLTFAEGCRPDERGPAYGICHIGEPDAPPVWWFGFDCLHSCDLGPAMAARMRELRRDRPDMQALHDQVQRSEFRDVYRSVTYVMQQCAELAQQLSSHSQGELI